MGDFYSAPKKDLIKVLGGINCFSALWHPSLQSHMKASRQGYSVYKGFIDSPQCVLRDLPADRRVPQPPQHEHVEYDDDGEGDRVAGYEEGELPDGQVVLLLVELAPLYKRRN